MSARDEESERREFHKVLFLKLLGHLGMKEFDAFEDCLASDFVQEWPYSPLPSLPQRVSGAREVRNLIEAGMSDFDPFRYEVHSVYELLDPDMLIAEYSSHSHYRRRDVPYSNRYLSILSFRGERLAHWREYVNPLVIREALLDDFNRTIADRTGLSGQ